MTEFKTMGVVIGASLLFGSLAVPAAAEPLTAVTQSEPSPEACTRTIQAMGASMGYTAVPGETPRYLFTLRVNGLDYMALCDALTGTVKDVVPKTSH